MVYILKMRKGMRKMKDKSETVLIKSNRVIWLDVVKFICIMCVILSHTETCIEEIEVFFTPFYLSAFFFCSGYIHKLVEFKPFVKKKVMQLLVPWFVFSMLQIAFLYVVNGRSLEYAEEHGSILKHIVWNFLQIRGLDDGMWFVAALFVAYFPFYYVVKFYGGKNKVDNMKLCLIGFGLSMIYFIYSQIVTVEVMPYNSIGLPWHLEYIFYAMFFMILGYLFKGEYENIFDKYNTLVNRLIATMVYVVVVYGVYFLKLPNGMLKSFAIQYIIVILSIVVVVAWCKVIKYNKYVMFVGQNTLIYFGLHSFVYRLIEKIVNKMTWYQNILYSDLLSIIASVSLTIVVSIILIVPTIIIERYLPWIVGRKKSLVNNK